MKDLALRAVTLIEHGLSQEEIVLLLHGEGLTREEAGYVYVSAQALVSMREINKNYKRP